MVYTPRVRTGFLLAILAYAAVIWAAGFRPSRLRGGLDAFFLASRALGPARVAFSLCASWIGAASLLVSTDEASRDGLSAIWIVGVPAVVTLLVLAALARPVRASAGLTLSELMRRRYGRAAETTTTVLIVWYMTVLAASQLVAAGPFLAAFLGTGPALGMAAAVAVVMAYSAAGGFQAVARTHVVQFVLLIVGVAGMAASLAGRVPWGAVKAAAAGLGKASYFDVLAGGGRSLLIAASFVLAWTISPIAWQRMQAARSETAARRGAALAALVLGLFYVGIVTVGMLFLPFFPGGATGAPLVTRFAASGAGPFLGGLVFVTVLAAVLSTTDAALNAGAFTLTKDLLGRRSKRSRAAASERSSLRLARISSLALAAAALLIAVRLGDILKTLGLASTIMAEGLLVPGLAALFLRRRAPLAGLLSLLLGSGHAIVGFLAESGLVLFPVPPWPRSLPLGVGLGAAGFLVGLLLERVRGRRTPPAAPGA
jgi:solute:Na+ symporter, SSS family